MSGGTHTDIGGVTAAAGFIFAMADIFLRARVNHTDHLETLLAMSAAGVGTTGSRGRIVILGRPGGIRLCRSRGAARRLGRRRRCRRVGTVVPRIIGVNFFPLCHSTH